jgi:hypothetical protein
LIHCGSRYPAPACAASLIPYHPRRWQLT